jgi:protein-disulfide isomerase
LEIRFERAWLDGGTQLKADKKYYIAGLAVVALLIGSAAAWRYFNDADLMTASPLGEIVLGRKDAPVTIIEYASTTCPHCAHFYKVTFPELQKRFIDTGQVRYVFREFPLNDIDVFAFMLARCAGNDRFFSIVDVLFKEQEKWAVDSPIPPLTELAKQSGFTDESLDACRADQKTLDGVFWSSRHGIKFGVESTPTFFINGAKHTGDMSIEKLQELIAQNSKG